MDDVLLMRDILHIAKFIASHPLTRDQQFAAWWRVVSWQLKSRMSSEVIVPWLGGRSLAACRGMRGITGNIYAGVHEFRDMMLTMHFLRPGDLFLDIGANVGSYAILASGVSGATTWAFEPDPVTLGFLARNIALNELGDLIQTFDCALGDADGEVCFTVGLDTNNKVLTESDGENVRRVPQRRLDGLTNGASPIMIKMDTEGHEDHVFSGARETLARDGLRVIIAETVSPAVQDMLMAQGFVQGYYDPKSRLLSRRPNALKSFNSCWVRDWDFVQTRLLEAPAVEVLGSYI